MQKHTSLPVLCVHRYWQYLLFCMASMPPCQLWLSCHASNASMQAGLILWQQLLPKKAAAAREELLKLDLAGVSQH